MNGLFVVDGGFELLCRGTTVGRRRHLNAAAMTKLEGFATRYAQLVNSAFGAAGLLVLGRELYDWLNGDGGQFDELMQRAPRPLRFEVCSSQLIPTAAEWSLLRAPWELLADQQGFLAGDVGLGFSPVRRLGRQVEAPCA